MTSSLPVINWKAVQRDYQESCDVALEPWRFAAALPHDVFYLLITGVCAQMAVRHGEAAGWTSLADFERALILHGRGYVIEAKKGT